ncbi:Serine/threonine-protein kinase ATG1 [Emericellopsis cladophorae]|uniref:non-specific serine/threonine protein kinase n=1 Tax=Emericellopsis cladophorae TaxID=2686198 RepID=A0A9P9XWG3_9HYPO|nr:Serine/threonine-protein kinase ATG1 [Emericellopsis cladophorae]KAI6778818.1 Serine/threonine-protein kinase ATG1 [Emericellopsis cladophorae]
MASARDAGPQGIRRLRRTTVGQFVIEKEIGKGSFAQVYQGLHRDTKQIVAIKSVELERLNKKLKENLYSEIQILKTLRHPHIVALHDCVESSTHINLIMEYCELGDLSLFIKKREKLITHPATHDMARKYPSAPNSGLHEVVIRHFLKQLSSALEFLRLKNYVHRDVKPQNLLLLPAKSAPDFGFARVLPSTSLADTLCGSPLYMAPEILRYERYDAKADLWSVGTVLYEMITGRPPFKARNHVELLRKIEAAEDVIKFPREVTVTADLKALVRALLKRNPVERLSFENFFQHPVVTTDIPGLVEDDLPKVAPQPKADARKIPTGRTPEEEKAAQDVMFERDYVVVERRHVEVNALADELAANEKMSPRAGQMARRSTQQGTPTSTTGAIPTPSRTELVARGHASHERRSSYEKALSSSPGSASSAISKAIQDASLRLFGFKVPHILGQKGQSPPMYQAFPAYPAPATTGLIGDVRTSHAADEDAMAAHTIEELATRSDCVYGFAEVKYKQLVPMAPSAERGLGGADVDQLNPVEDGLTVEAVVSLSEEALVLYVKSLTLLARAMDIASVWWSKRSRGETSSGLSNAVAQTIVQRINAVVQWVRQRFNEVLEKSEVVRLRLTESQRGLPEDHPSHPSNQGLESATSAAGSTGVKDVYLTPGISAEKLMYDRALEMSRAAAIDEVTNENLGGCELSYVTAIRMLEAVVDSDEDSSKKIMAGKEPAKDVAPDIDSDEEQHIRKKNAFAIDTRGERRCNATQRASS